MRFLLVVALSIASADNSVPTVVTLIVNVANKTHRLRPLDHGCHSDTGYNHQPMGLHAQRIYGSSFEDPPVAKIDGTGWVDACTGSGKGGAVLDSTTSFHGTASEKLTLSTTGGRAAVANRGLGNEGLYFESNKVYEGYFFAKASQPTKLVLAIEAWSTNSTDVSLLASSTVTIGANSSGNHDWERVNFSLTPTAATECVGIKPKGPEALAAGISCPVNGTYDPTGGMSDRTAHVCVQCSGQFVMSLTEPGKVNLDFVYLAPGPWGRFQGLPVLAEGVKWLQGERCMQ
jgi:hypothetical protein